jgi:hypothetical protein
LGLLSFIDWALPPSTHFFFSRFVGLNVLIRKILSS